MQAVDTAPAAEALDIAAADIAAAAHIEEQDNHTEDFAAAADTAAAHKAAGKAVDMAPVAGIAAADIAADTFADTVVGDTAAAGTVERDIEAADTAAGIAQLTADTAVVDTEAVDRFVAASASWERPAAAEAFLKRVCRQSATAAAPEPD